MIRTPRVRRRPSLARAGVALPSSGISLDPSGAGLKSVPSQLEKAFDTAFPRANRSRGPPEGSRA
ncbi:MAG TPA: hypothetical protein VKO87_00820 [Gemmatimonadaceae bacterium]|nr:hypothetical protein [Gemmatimonadaceae bacterium]